MRIRTIKPSFWSSATMATVSRDARLVFIGLWNIADDEGRLLGGAKGLAGALFEHDDDVDSKQMSAWLDELEGRRLIERYSVKGTAYICVSGFSEHQKIDKRFPSRLPPPPDAVGESPRLLPDVSAGSPRSVGGESASEVGSWKSEVGSQKSEGECAASPPEPAPALEPVVDAEFEEVLPPSTLQRLEQRGSEAIVRSGRRTTIAAKAAASSALFGRPQTPRALLDLRVVEDDDKRLSMAPEGVDGVTLRDLWSKRYKSLDGKGAPVRSSLAEVVERLWDHSLAKPWQTDGGGWGTRYLAWWSGHLATDAQRVRQAWERDGGTAGGDPERGAAKRKYHELHGLGRDLPPFETWFADYKRGATETTTPSSSPGSGARPTGPRSGAAPVHAADVMRATHDAMAELNPDAGAAGLAAMKAKTTRPRAPIADDVDIASEVQS